MVRVAVFGITTIVLAALPARAQSSHSGRPGHGFATVGMVGTWGDPADEINVTSQTVNRGHLLASGAVFVAPRVGVGIETFPEHDTSAQLSNTLLGTQSGQLQEKTALMVTARGRALARSHFALDGVFGVGALRQTRTYIFQYRFPETPPTPPTATATDNTSAAYSLGADTTISLVTHLAVIPQMRWYHLRRLGDHASFPSAFSAPAWLFAFGVTAGVTW